MQSITYIVAFSLIAIGLIVTITTAVIGADHDLNDVKKHEKALEIIWGIFALIALFGLALYIGAAAFMTQSQYNKAVIGTTMTGKPSTVVIDNNTKLRLNATTDTLSLVPINDSISIQQANGNTNFKANIVVTYKMIKNEKSILNFYKTYGTSDVKKIVNNVIKSEVAKQDSFAKSGKISEETIKNIDKRLNHTFEFESITATDFVSSNNQNINLNTSK